MELKHKVNDTVWVKKHIVEVDDASLNMPYQIDNDHWPLITNVKGLDELWEYKQVRVPKWFSDWIVAVALDEKSFADAKITLIGKILQQGWCYSFTESAKFSESDHSEELFHTAENMRYIREHKLELIEAVINGYEIIEEVFEIPLPDLQTTDGEIQYVSRTRDHADYFASRKNAELQQTFTKTELEQIPEAYKQYATKVEA
ncbi:hypothetical protein [Lactobacillus acetotolerans]|uniref:hypothetical protein n=1 Tax=Lactobacillus acetotolerans TaxID=1600 RepID=UPI002FD9FC29